MREGIDLPTGSAAFERSLSGMKRMEELHLGMEIWFPDKSFLILCLWKEQTLNTSIKCNLVKSLVLRQSTLMSLFYNACASSVVSEKG